MSEYVCSKCGEKGYRLIFQLYTPEEIVNIVTREIYDSYSTCFAECMTERIRWESLPENIQDLWRCVTQDIMDKFDVSPKTQSEEIIWHDRDGKPIVNPAGEPIPLCVPKKVPGDGPVCGVIIERASETT